jgi:sugar lactone lactonase YvrE
VSRAPGFPAKGAAALVLAAALLGGNAGASEVREAKAAALRLWERGRLQALTLSPEGALALAPALRPLNLAGAEPPPYMLCQARDRDGNLYVGAGGPARIFRFTPHGNASLWFQGEELQVSALAIDSKGRLYAATSPRGRVYRISAAGEATPFFEAEERYLWSLLIDREDQLWVGSGERGRLYRVDAGGRGRVVLDSPDPHITALALDGDGALVVGTDGRGLVYHVARDGRARTLLEGGLRQVSALAVARDGAVYAGLVAPTSPAPAPAKRPAAERAAGIESAAPLPFERETTLPLGEEAPPPLLAEALEPPQRPLPRSRIVRLDRSGAAREVWSAEGEWLHALALASDGTLYFGTGEPARLYSLGGDGPPVLTARPEAAHLTSLLAAEGGRLGLATGRPGLAWVAGGGLAESGSAESEPFDAGALARWGRVWWRAETPPGARVEVFSRSGNSARPDSAWSDWSAAYADTSGSSIVSPAGRYLQWKVAIQRGRDSGAPRLSDLAFSYLPANQPPRLELVTVHPAGDYFLPDSGAAPPGRPRRRAGVRSVSWQAIDPDGDRLSATLRLRSLPGGEWTILAEGVTAPYYSWSVAGLSEGWHEIDIEVADLPANPAEAAGRARSAPRAFRVDVTPPRIEITREQIASNPPTLEFRVSDALSPVRSVQVWEDAAPPRLLWPADGIEDSTREEYRWQGSARPRRLRIEAGDSEGNRGEWVWQSASPPGA